MTKRRLEYVCMRCGRRYPWDTHAWRCACGGPFELAERPAFRPDALLAEGTLWRYRAMLPLPEDAEPVSLGEGGTPLVPVELPDGSFLAKLEFLAPTGSFKDRGTTVLVSALKALSVSQVHDDSSGNAAASLAAYCARAGIECTLYVPAYASPAKRRQIEAYGAKLVSVAGPRTRAAQAAQEVAKRGESYYASHAYHPLILEGTKTLAYELWERLPEMPRALIFPTGHGTLLLGTYRGLQDLQAAGLIERFPKLIAAQSEACAPLYEAFHQDLEGVPPEWAERPGGETIAEGIRIPCPPRAPEILKALRGTGGTVVAVSDEEIQNAQQALAHRGLLVEPTSAAAVAAWRKLLQRGLLEADGTVVVPLTGSGLKALTPESAPAT